jgi:hypothetical protein
MTGTASANSSSSSLVASSASATEEDDGLRFLFVCVLFIITFSRFGSPF